jgi:hypothetical protein
MDKYMENFETNYNKYKAQFLKEPENLERYNLARERVKIDMMLEILREQIIEEVEKPKLLRQISKIRKNISDLV